MSQESEKCSDLAPRLPPSPQSPSWTELHATTKSSVNGVRRKYDLQQKLKNGLDISQAAPKIQYARNTSSMQYSSIQGPGQDLEESGLVTMQVKTAIKYGIRNLPIKRLWEDY